jgi:cobalamin biosynthetic protein CobC
MQRHGGDLDRARAQFGGEAGEWLDLSTGINPEPWPQTQLPAEIWNHLPQPRGEALQQGAAHFYGGLPEQFAVVPGAQAAIQHLPYCLQADRVAVVSPTYSEHWASWSRAGSRVEALPLEREADFEPRSRALLEAANQYDAVVLGQPNNPTGTRWPQGILAEAADRLAARGGHLIVDAAFADADGEALPPLPDAHPGLIILRSLGKFFGLPGVRLGWLQAEAGVAERMREAVGPWPVSTAAEVLGTRILADPGWPLLNRQRLGAARDRLRALLRETGWRIRGSSPLFVLAEAEDAPQRLEHLIEHKVWPRTFDDAGLEGCARFGLPHPDSWGHLEGALLAAGG